MENKELNELIDEFLLGRIQAGDLARLEFQRTTNPDIDEQVNQSIAAFQILQYARYKEIRQKLREIDASESDAKPVSKHKKWIIAGVFILIFILGLWMWAIKELSPSSLAERHFISMSLDAIAIGKISDEELINWELACTAFKNQEFSSSIMLFQPFLENPEYGIMKYAQWNILLARLGLQGPDPDWKAAIKHFESLAPDYFKPKIASLLRIIDSPFYKVFVLKKIPHLSALKPSLM